MNKKWIFLLLGCVLISGSSWALNKPALALHLRKALNLTMNDQIDVGDPEHREIGGLLAVPISLRGITRTIYVSPDEKYYIWGDAFTMSEDPDVKRASLINLKGAHQKGSSKAPVTIVEFTDLQCPYCKNAHEAISKELYKNYSRSQVRWVYKHFPLSMHKWAIPAAIACECAAEQNEKTIWPMSELFFNEAASIKEETVRDKGIEFANKLGLNISQFKQCLDGESAKKKVMDDMEEGRNAGVSSTPTLFINGRMIRGFRDFKDLKVYIDEKLKEKK